MFPKTQITDSIYYVGVNDRTKDLFESMWPLPYGVSYNSYLIVDEKITLVDTVDICYSEIFFSQIRQVIGDRPIDYLIVDHMEPDHSGSIGMLRRLYPEMQVIGNKLTFGMLKEYFPDLEGGLIEVKEGDTLSTGKHELTFVTAPMVHWPEVMFTYDKTDKVLFSADAFGTFGSLDGNIIDKDMNLDRFFDEMYRYYSCIVGKYGSFVQKTLQKVLALNLPVDYVCSTHGPIWTEVGFGKALKIYDQLSKYEAEKGAVVLYGSMYGNTTVLADTIARAMALKGIKNIVCYDVSRTDPSVIIRDVFKYRAVVLGAPTYSNDLFTPMRRILMMLEVREVKNRICGLFGSFTWGSQAVKKLQAFSEDMQWTVIGNSVEQKGATKEAQAQQAIALGEAIAEELHNLYPEA